jgi:hypothetical protein
VIPERVKTEFDRFKFEVEDEIEGKEGVGIESDEGPPEKASVD